ncbi:MAG: Thymidylate kinase [Candidatus Collierbacteria bacterium GW2011_GWC2_44_18]|uniref:Thymidylate kinase n=1 Tax=Candidatus Collierbacteria bacterium GW2011_GWC2_44_18 TaxID=1618392 RepID=A0A0G1HMI1_9BACT|nr:MAG: Thymidylate kinase [Microgenomates group bacterium GW2011_GWC1_44_10]KKT48411.1 MAG: Thymidylate kinase [Candidatus Collierbacteria bacterium GW2011_GWC2_44_18]
MGRFIVIYGSNNLGKSKQLDLLEQEYQGMGVPYTRIKYPIYDSPTGEIINRVLRPDENGNKPELSEEEFQAIYAENRRQFEPTLLCLLESGDVIAEDYVGTGLAWGITKGVNRGYLDEINAGLLKPDVEIMLDGYRFGGGIERRHRHEDVEKGVWERSREVHLELANELGWEIVNANDSPEKVHERIVGVLAGV